MDFENFEKNQPPGYILLKAVNLAKVLHNRMNHDQVQHIIAINPTCVLLFDILLGCVLETKPLEFPEDCAERPNDWRTSGESIENAHLRFKQKKQD